MTQDSLPHTLASDDQVVLRQEIGTLQTAITALTAQQELLQNLLTVALSASEPLEATLQKALEISIRLTRAESGSLFLLEGNSIPRGILARGETSVQQRQDLIRAVMEKGLAGWVARHREAALIADTLNDQRWTTLPDQPYTARSVLAVPILREQSLLAVLTLIHAQPGHFRVEHSRLMQVTANQIAMVLDNARLYANLQQARDELEHRVQERTAELAAANTGLQTEIAERKRAEAALQTLSQQLLTAQESERRHIARELHDEIGQSLTALKINLQALQRLSSASAIAPQLNDSVSIVERVLLQVRDLSLDLRPSLLDDLGLEVALRWYLRRQAERLGWETELIAELPAEPARLPADVETTCFRVVQEALTNAARYAQARRVEIELRSQGAELTLIIRDDGVGFDLPEAQKRAQHGASLGLLGMQERVLLAGGQIGMQSTPGQGTEIRVQFPLASATFPAEDS